MFVGQLGVIGAQLALIEVGQLAVAYGVARGAAGAEAVVGAHRTYGPVVMGVVGRAGLAGVIPAPARI